MAFKIVKTPNKVLSKKAKPVSKINESVRALAKGMVMTLVNYDNKYEIGAAIAAPQVGESVRLIVVRRDFENARTKNNPKKDFRVIVNPRIAEKSDEIIEDMEGCLSIPTIYGQVKRQARVTVTGLDLNGDQIRLKASGFEARVLQHEIDHLEGTLFTDRVEDLMKLSKMDEQGRLSGLTSKFR